MRSGLQFSPSQGLARGGAAVSVDQSWPRHGWEKSEGKPGEISRKLPWFLDVFVPNVRDFLSEFSLKPIQFWDLWNGTQKAENHETWWCSIFDQKSCLPNFLTTLLPVSSKTMQLNPPQPAPLSPTWARNGQWLCGSSWARQMMDPSFDPRTSSSPSYTLIYHIIIIYHINPYKNYIELLCIPNVP